MKKLFVNRADFAVKIAAVIAFSFVTTFSIYVVTM